MVSELYRLAPHFPFPAAVEDSTAVYAAAVKTYAPGKIALYGTSAGAVLSAQTAVQLRKNSVPLPAVLGFFSGMSTSRGTVTPDSFTGLEASRISAP